MITNGLVLLSGAMLIPIYAMFVEKIGGDLLEASFTGGVFALAAGITALFAGKFSNKCKRPELIITFSYFLMSLGFFLYLFVSSIWFLFGVQILIGFAEASSSPAFDSLFSKHITSKRAGRQWGAWEAIDYFSVAFGAALGGLIVTFFGFNAIFIVMSVLCLFSAVYMFYVDKKIF